MHRPVTSVINSATEMDYDVLDEIQISPTLLDFDIKSAEEINSRDFEANQDNEKMDSNGSGSADLANLEFINMDGVGTVEDDCHGPKALLKMDQIARVQKHLPNIIDYQDSTNVDLLYRFNQNTLLTVEFNRKVVGKFTCPYAMDKFVTKDLHSGIDQQVKRGYSKEYITRCDKREFNKVNVRLEGCLQDRRRSLCSRLYISINDKI